MTRVVDDIGNDGDDGVAENQLDVAAAAAAADVRRTPNRQMTCRSLVVSGQFHNSQCLF